MGWLGSSEVVTEGYATKAKGFLKTDSPWERLATHVFIPICLLCTIMTAFCHCRLSEHSVLPV